MNLKELEKDKKKLEELRKLEREGKYTLIEKELEELTEKYLKITTDNKEVLRFKADLLLVASIVTLYQADYKEARRLAEEAVEILKRTRDYHRLPFALSRLAETYRYGGDLVKAEKLDREAIKVIEENPRLTKVEKEYLFDVFKLSIMFDCVWYYERGQADDFFERRKIETLNTIGRKEFCRKLFG